MVLPIPKSCSVAEWTIIPASHCQIGLVLLTALLIIRYTYYTVEASFKINQQKTNKKKEITRFLFLVFSSIESFLV
jgi:hypothetical protein